MTAALRPSPSMRPSSTRLAEKPVWSFNSDGTVMDLADPDPASVCFIEIGNSLSKIIRFNGKNTGAGVPVAQHCVMGAQAILNEGGTRHEAALFLLHDGHEWALGDQIRPFQSLIDRVCAELYGDTHLLDAIAAVKSAWDEAIYFAAGLPGPEAWPQRMAKLVKAMDDRMCRAEAIALFGHKAACQFPKSALPKLTGAIRPWGPAKAEESFRKMANQLIGEDRVIERAAIAAAARALR